MVTINLGAVREVAEIETMMAKARRDFRNLIDRQRRDSGVWEAVEALAWMETDAFDLEDYPRLGPDKQEQYAQFIQVFHGSSGVIWCPHLHGVIRLTPGLDVGTVRTAFERQWPGHRRVDVRTFTDEKSMIVNLGDIINYALKADCTTEYYNAETGETTYVEWETAWLGEYYTWLHGWSRGSQSLRLSINPKMCDEAAVACVDYDEEMEIEPLPFACSFSVFPTDYYTGNL